MEIKAEKNLRIARSAAALIIAAAMIIGSVFSVAAAVQSSAEPEKSTEGAGKFTASSENELSNGDLIISDINNFSLSVDIIKASKITIVNGDSETSVMLAKGTVNDALEKAGVTLGKNETAVPCGNTDITGDMTVEIKQGVEISVTADGKTESFIAAYGTVGEALENAGYALGKDDILSKSADSRVANGMNITIQRVTYGEEISDEEIVYETVKENSDSIDLGETSVKTEGVNGLKQITKKCRYVDGKKTSEEVVGEKVIKEPVDKVVLIGTKGTSLGSIAGTFTDYNGATVAYSRVITGSGTAYTAPAGAGTATGVPAYHGGVAVNPNVIPYGSKLYVVSTDGSFVYGYCTAVDTGGALMDGSAVVDCFYNTYDECVNFGRRNVNVYVVG